MHASHCGAAIAGEQVGLLPVVHHFLADVTGTMLEETIQLRDAVQAELKE